MSKTELIDHAETLGLSIPMSWTKERIILKIKEKVCKPSVNGTSRPFNDDYGSRKFNFFFFIFVISFGSFVYFVDDKPIVLPVTTSLHCYIHQGPIDPRLGRFWYEKIKGEGIRVDIKESIIPVFKLHLHWLMSAGTVTITSIANGESKETDIVSLYMLFNESRSTDLFSYADDAITFRDPIKGGLVSLNKFTGKIEKRNVVNGTLIDTRYDCKIMEKLF